MPFCGGVPFLESVHTDIMTVDISILPRGFWKKSFAVVELEFQDNVELKAHWPLSCVVITSILH